MSSLSRLELTAAVAWTLPASFNGRPSADIKDKVNYTVQPDVAVTNKLYAATLTFTSGEVKTLDLTSLTAPNGEAVSFTNVQGIILAPVGQSIAIAAGGTNGLTWRAETVGDGDVSLFTQKAGKTVDATHRTLSLTAGAGAVSLEIVIYGSG